MTLKKAILCFFLVFFAFTANAAAQEVSPQDDSLRDRDMGIYLLSKIVDETEEPIEGVEVVSSLEKVITDQNGEFFIRIAQNDTIILNKPEYKETFIEVSQIRGRVTLEKIPQYLSLYPNVSISAFYRNLGFSESFNSITSSGRLNDSLSIEGTYKLFNSFLAQLAYENMSAKLNRRNNTNDITDFGNHTFSLTGSYLMSLRPDILEAALGLKGFYNSVSVGLSPSLDIDRDPDYLDSGYSQFGIGPELSVSFRPIRYTPFVLSGTLGYFPFIGVSQPQEGQLPANLNGFDYKVTARYDVMGIFIKSQFVGRQRFRGEYSSGFSGISAGIGYGF